jgi:hypothetical protein
MTVFLAHLSKHYYYCKYDEFGRSSIIDGWRLDVVFFSWCVSDLERVTTVEGPLIYILPGTTSRYDNRNDGGVRVARRGVAPGEEASTVRWSAKWRQDHYLMRRQQRGGWRWRRDHPDEEEKPDKRRSLPAFMTRRVVNEDKACLHIFQDLYVLLYEKTIHEASNNILPCDGQLFLLFVTRSPDALV